MGGNRITAMVGASGLKRKPYATENGLQFGFGLNRKMNTVRITLNSNDLYDIEFWQITKKTCKLVSEYPDVYCDMLVDIFESETGLYLSL